MTEINQEYVNLNIDKIVEFMKTCEPDKAIKNSRNWRFSLLKDYKPKIHIIVCYQKYTECENIKKNYEDRIDKFYDKEQELDERIKREESTLKNLEEQGVNWRKITRILSCKLQEYISAREYLTFVSEFPSYYGL
tara:strand:- start:28 stop:432 length:405 start_codon:yes stop_codon:yes gene_type:complete